MIYSVDKTLTAFVLKSFAQASPYIYVYDKHSIFVDDWIIVMYFVDKKLTAFVLMYFAQAKPYNYVYEKQSIFIADWILVMHFVVTRLTAFVLKSFAQASPYIYVSASVIQNAARWMTGYQNSDGSFQVIGSVHSTQLQVR